jgi:hypothetical protein
MWVAITIIVLIITLGIDFCVSEIIDYLRERDTLNRKNQK